MSVNLEIKHVCEFCNREFQRESTLVAHSCEYKNRWAARNLRGNQLGFQAYLEFYSRNQNSKRTRDYAEFTRSQYYGAFVRFGTYCHDIRAIAVPRFIEWLLTNQIKIDTWNRDTNYTKFLIHYLKHEAVLDAIQRGIETSIELAQEQGIPSHDILRYGNVNRNLYAITSGRLSAWVLLQSRSGQEFVGSLNSAQIGMVHDYLDTETWALAFVRRPEDVATAREILDAAGW